LFDGIDEKMRGLNILLDIIIALDSTRIKVANRGEWIQHQTIY
jgi:hypothetical protein